MGVNSLAHNTHIMGDFAYISHYTVGVTVVDISDPTNLIEVAQYDTYPLNDNSSFHGCWEPILSRRMEWSSPVIWRDI